MTRLWLGSAGWVACVAWSMGCSSTGSTQASSDAGGDGSSSSGGQSDSGSSGGISCANPPGSGTPCTGGITCEYGTDQNLACNKLEFCLNDSWWISQSPNTDCPTQMPGDAGCPATGPAVGQSCTREVNCLYAHGLCGCGLASTALGPDFDAGLSWRCEDAGSDCPVPRPRAGDACTTPGKTCYYGACNLANGPSPLTCVSGLWTLYQVDQPPCP